jgi:hypothetical protein
MGVANRTVVGQAGPLRFGYVRPWVGIFGRWYKSVHHTTHYPTRFMNATALLIASRA